MRWRCNRSILATRGGVREREAFGQQTTAFNKAQAERMNSKNLPRGLQETHPVVYNPQTMGSL
jgi:hypothetical protein